MDHRDPPHPSGIDRRTVIALGVGALAVVTLPWSRRDRRKLVRRSVPLMGTIAEIAVVDTDPLHAHAAIDAALREMSRVDRTMSRFSPFSDVGRANELAARDAVHIEPATSRVIAEAVRWADGSAGAFDPCMGKATALWDVLHRRQPPSAAEVHELAGRKLYRTLDLDDWRGGTAVRFEDRDAAIDLGGIAKGFAVDRAVDGLRREGVTSGLVNLGGDLYALGRSPDGDDWRVGIRSPHDPGTFAETMRIRDAAVATSGDYLQFFDYQGRRYHHLLDPATAEPWRTSLHSVTVTADTCITADAAATTVFGMAPATAHPLLHRVAPDACIVRRL